MLPSGKGATLYIHSFLSQLWCATRVGPNYQYIAGNYGYCSITCPLALLECRTIDGPVIDAYCKFPFSYEGQTYYDCTSVDDNREWCAVETDDHGVMLNTKWGYCQCHSAVCGYCIVQWNTLNRDTLIGDFGLLATKHQVPKCLDYACSTVQ